MLREQSKNFYVPNIYHFDTSTCKSLVGLLYHKYMLWSKSVVDLHILQIILLFKWRVQYITFMIRNVFVQFNVCFCSLSSHVTSGVSSNLMFAKYFRKTSGVNSSWITENFRAPLHPNAPKQEIERYATVWLWHFLGAFLFPDALGNTISQAFLNILSQPWENIGAYSWGSAVLAWIYRQLCVAYRRSIGGANRGGCSHLLQVWCWERWPVESLVVHGLPVSASIFYFPQT